MTKGLERRQFLTGLGAAAAAATLLPACGNSSTSPQPNGAELIPYDPSDWSPGYGNHGSTRIPISQATGQVPGRIGTYQNRVRITADARTPTDRECYVLNSTLGTADSEISSTWYPTLTNGRFPQMGHVHRATKHGAIVIDQDLFGGMATWIAVWNWDGKGELHAPIKAVTTSDTSDQPVILRWQRPKARPDLIVVSVDQPGGVRKHDRIRIVGTGVKGLDGDWTVNGIFEHAIFDFGVTGPALSIRDPSHARVVPSTPVRGLIEYQGTTVRSQYPRRVRSRVIGNLAQAKQWNARVAEPPWEPGVYRGGESWQLDLSKLPQHKVPHSGSCGILANHLAAGGHVDYDDITITRL